ncbi:hypothetical protein GCM10009682_21270 [Luedemannella flava]|uniref:NIF system FeS cluster assembly NifU C-terminal domain-containing protein n=1 Tax=Luedemannella flava TaxID=349316 RepID=A0ABP4Y5M5_9ACTN
MVPIHPQPCPDQPDRVRWVIPAGWLPCVGPLAACPSPLDALVADGTLVEVAAEPAAVLTRLGPGRSWAVDGPRVRTALHAALDDPAGWHPAAAATSDAALAAAAGALLAGAAGRFARSHGGVIDLVDVRDGVVTVRLGGACHGCPAARATLRERLDRQLRRMIPSLHEVREARG